MLAGQVAGFRTIHQMHFFSAVFVFLALLATGALLRRSEYTAFRFFFVAWIVAAAGGLVYSMTLEGLLPLTVWTYGSLQIGSGLQAILLTAALADRVSARNREEEENRRNETRYMRLAITDSLTGLYNAHHFEKGLTAEIEKAEAAGLPLSLVMLEIDDFDAFSKTNGPMEADKVIAKLGEEIRSSVRDGDVPCRLDGREFALILPGAWAQEAEPAAERLRGEFESQEFSPDGGVARLTLSIGVAEHVSGQKPSKVIEKARKALGEAKSLGKNRVVLSNGGNGELRPTA